MYNTRMLYINRVFFRLLILTLLVNFSVVGVKPAYLFAQITEQELAATDDDQASLEAEVLKEINRARTDPQGYADWLEEQKQHFNGILLQLPGEKPVRTNKGLKALEEAILFLEEQQPLSPLKTSEQLTGNATTQIENLANNQAEGNISYGRVTAKGIVMNLVVDDGFPDRRHRISLFNPDLKLAGIICQTDARYQKICAIAYSEEEAVDVANESDSETNSETTDNLNTETNSASGTETLPTPPQVAAVSESTKPDKTEVSQEDDDDSESETEASQEDDDDSESETEASQEDNDNSESETEVSQEDDDDSESETEVSQEDDDDSESETSGEESAIITNNSNNSRLLEKIKRGILEEGDKIIPDDGSFYDSYPLKGNAGDSFIISLESDEFDTFVAVMDSEGKILDQNDDINDDNSNSRLKITLPSDGVYSVIVNAYDKEGKGRYTLTVRR